MKVTTQTFNKVIVVELNGEFTSEFAHSFEKKMGEIINNKIEGLVLDCSNVGYLDSRALECLVWLRDECSNHLLQLKLAGLDESCEKILEITRLNEKFDKYAELSEAVKSFA